MSGWTCLQAQLRMERKSSGASEAEKLELELHLEACPTCRAEAQAIDRIAALVRDGSARERAPKSLERVLSRAMDARPESAGSTVASPARSTRVLATAAAAAAAVALWAGWSALDAPQASPVATAPRSTDRAIDLARGDEAAVAHARVRAIEDTVARWTQGASTLELLAGALEVHVDPEPRLPFRVACDRFDVEVLGTRFVVDPTHVEVIEGIVRIRAHAGGDVVLRAGERYDVGELREATTALAPVVPEAPPDLVAPAMPEPPSGAASPRAATRAPAHPDGDPEARLAGARSALARGEVVRAEREARAVLASAPPPAHRAEARTLLAECAVASGRPDEAIELYVEIARTDPTLAAGDNAAFAAARLAWRSGRRERARSLFAEYLTRFPRGRFRDEAAARLAEP